ncbi:MAG: stage II sporulation protein P [Lacrimispora sp.]|uniref:stage II sporulation protein P n=1 Tax=Lacrimispora sp. TaxID=2719234 RepID=UPI0039E534C2
MRQRDRGINWFIKNMMIAVSLILAVFLAGKTGGFQRAAGWLKGGAGFGISYIWHIQYPGAVWEEGDNGDFPGGFFGSVLFGGSPLYRYKGKRERPKAGYNEADPAYEGYLESGRFYEEHSFLLYDGGEESGEDGSVNAEVHKAPEAQAPAQTEVLAEKDPALTCSSSSIWPIVGATYRREQLADYDYLMKHFYSVHASTTAGRDLMQSDRFLSEDFTVTGGSDKPQILIYHTHSQEEFADHGPDNPGATVVGIGNYLTELLTAKGYNVIHDTSVYDLQGGKLDRNKAYTLALEGISGILQENPSIEVILDVHRDGVNESLHMVNEVNGKPTAPIMFFNGVSQTPKGQIEYLPNPNREKNLAFSFQMQLDAAAYFPGLTRKIYIKGLRYNQHLRARSALIEVGAQTNTYQEALNAMEPLAEVLDMVLQGN